MILKYRVYNNNSNSYSQNKNSRWSEKNATRTASNSIGNENISPRLKQHNSSNYTTLLISPSGGANSDIKSERRSKLSSISNNQLVHQNSSFGGSKISNSSALLQSRSDRSNIKISSDNNSNWIKVYQNTPKFNYPSTEGIRDLNFEKEMERLKKTLGDIKDQEWKFVKILNKHSPDYKSHTNIDYWDSYDSSIKPSQFSTGNSKSSKQSTFEKDENQFLSESKNNESINWLNYKPTKRMFANSKWKANVISYYEKWSPQRFTVIDTPVLIEKSCK